MVLAIDKCTARVRVRDVHGYDVKATIINEKQKEKERTCLMYVEMFTSQNLI